MNKLMNWMFAAILFCGTVMCGLTSCTKEETKFVDLNADVELYTVKSNYEIVSTGNLTDANLKTVRNVLDKNFVGEESDRKTLSDARSGLDAVVKKVEDVIKTNDLFVQGLTYRIYVKLFDSKETLVYSKTVTVENDQISTK
jgi:hypothetical protein